MTVGSRTVKLLIEAMAKHLPPSASTLSLLDVDGVAGDILKSGRADLQITAVNGDSAVWGIQAETFDAVVAFNRTIDNAFLNSVMLALRPGGRFIMVSVDDSDGTDTVQTLEKAGYTRILVETGIECPLPIGQLMRGEKPHTTDDTLERVKVASDQDADRLDWSTYNGRYLYLLIKQTPHKPAWKMTADDVIEWKAAAVERDGQATALAFSSLPKAVSFMQPAVLNKQIMGITKMAKFTRETAQTWAFGVAINALNEILDGAAVTWIDVDPSSAEAADE